MTTRSRLVNRGQRRGLSQIHFISAAATIIFFLLLSSAGASGPMSQERQRAARRTSWCRCPEPTGTLRRITVLFKGLFYFSIPNGEKGQPREECRVGILSSRQDHELFVTYYETGQKLSVPHSLLQSLGDITIEKKVATVPVPGITICGFDGASGWGVPRPRTAKPGVGDERYYHFNWIIDFEGVELHGEDIPLNAQKLRPLLHFRTGDFYTDAISDNEYFVIRNGIGKRFGYVAATTGACITLDTSRGEYLEIGGGISPALTINSNATILLANVRPEDEEHVRQFAFDLTALPSTREPGAHDKQTHPDEITIFYEDLLRLREPAKRAYFIPIQPLTRSDPFVCYGGGGSVFP